MFRRFLRSRLTLTILLIGGLITAFGLVLPTQFRGAQRVYRIGVNDDPPIQTRRPDGRFEGLSVDVVSEAARRAGIRLEWVYAPEGPDAALGSHKVDLWPVLTIRPEREGLVHISVPWLNNEYVLVARHAVGLDLSGRTLAILDLPVNHRIGAQYFPGAQIVGKASQHDAIEAVCTGQAEAFLESARGLVGILLSRPPGCEAANFHIVPVPRSRSKLGIGATLESAEVADALRKQVTNFATDGTLRDLFSKWNLPSSAETETIYQLIESQKRESLLTRGAGILAIVLIAVIWQVLRVREKQRMADRANAAKSDFLANMSHEIRTPLNGVIGMAELLSRADLKEGQREMANTILSSAEVLLALVNDILDFSKIEAGEMHMETLPFDPRETVRGIVAIFQCRAQAKGLDLEVQVADDVPERVRGDVMRVRQVLINLVGNAIKFTEAGAVRLEVAISEDAQQGRGISFCVADSGIGIEKDILKKLFAPFVQGDSATTRKYGGTGLGLAISRRLVELMGGSIQVQSEPGRGSNFRFTIPAGVCVENKEVREQPEGPSRAVPFSPRAQARILIAEDNTCNQLVALRCLRHLGYDAVVAGNGIEVLRALQASDFDLILMDCQMPEMDGYQTAAEIRRRESGARHIPIIAMTANAIEGDERQCLQSGMDGYLPKPVRLAGLEQVLHQWLATTTPEVPAGAAIKTP